MQEKFWKMNWKDKFPKENRYFETNNGILYCADCLKILPLIPNKSIDLILTDPPFMISQEIKIARSQNYKYKGKDINLDFGPWDSQWQSKEEYINWCKIWWKEGIRILKDYHHFLFFFDKAKISYAWDYMEENGMKGRSPVFWIKLNLVPRARKVDFMKAIEMCLWFTKKEVKVGYFNYQLGQHPDYFMYSIPQDNSKEGERTHPTQKPVAFCKWLISYLSNENEIVLDLFLGSGTTAIACEKLGRKWIGIEIDKTFCEVAKQRILKESKQLKLF